MSNPRLRILSLGAGVQSTSLLLLAVDDAIPAPDAAIVTDSLWEPQRVYYRRTGAVAEPRAADIRAELAHEYRCRAA
ncbi:MAG: hypothetical protein ACRDXX_05675 [Stackebrandtia sp.]